MAGAMGISVDDGADVAGAAGLVYGTVEEGAGAAGTDEPVYGTTVDVAAGEHPEHAAPLTLGENALPLAYPNANVPGWV